MFAKTGGLLGLISRLKPMEIVKWGSGSGTDHEQPEDRREAEFFNGANVVSSERTDWPGKAKRHAVLLDLDVPAYLVPSTTPGHSHLYVDLNLTEEAYFDFLDACAKVGLIEEGYAGASKAKGGTYLRLPWVKKEKREFKTPEPLDPWN